MHIEKLIFIFLKEKSMSEEPPTSQESRSTTKTVGLEYRKIIALSYIFIKDNLYQPSQGSSQSTTDMDSSFDDDGDEGEYNILVQLYTLKNTLIPRCKSVKACHCRPA